MTPEYYEKNKEKLKAQMRAYAERNKESLKAYYREYYLRNKSKWQTPEARERSRLRAKASASKTPPEELKTKRRRHYEKNRDKSIAQAKKWQRDNKEHKRAYDRARHEANRESKLASMRERYERNRPKWQAYYQERKELFREQGIAWRKANPEKVTSAQNRRRARLKNLGSTGVTPSEWKLILEQFDNLCAYCRKTNGSKRLERDHVIPISKGGLDNPENVVPACRTCNSRKAARLDWKP